MDFRLEKSILRVDSYQPRKEVKMEVYKQKINVWAMRAINYLY